MLKVVHEENESHEKGTGCGGSLLDQLFRLWIRGSPSVGSGQSRWEPDHRRHSWSDAGWPAVVSLASPVVTREMVAWNPRSRTRTVTGPTWRDSTGAGLGPFEALSTAPARRLEEVRMFD